MASQRRTSPRNSARNPPLTIPSIKAFLKAPPFNAGSFDDHGLVLSARQTVRVERSDGSILASVHYQLLHTDWFDGPTLSGNCLGEARAVMGILAAHVTREFRDAVVRVDEPDIESWRVPTAKDRERFRYRTHLSDDDVLVDVATGITIDFGNR